MDQGETRLLIGGALRAAADGGSFENIDPSTGAVLGVCADATAADMDAAIAAARSAFDHTEWGTDAALRKRCLYQLQAAITGEVEELRSELVAEVGCPILATWGPQLDTPLRDALSWPAEQIDEFAWVRSLGAKDAFGGDNPSMREVWKEPVGVVGAITPWNFPVEIILNKLGPLLAMGNTCVIKAAPDTPWNATRIGRLIAEATDIPPGVVNVVVGTDHGLGAQLVADPRVDMITFTGSTATGRTIMRSAADTLKRVFLELGGKSVNLFLDDADLATQMGSVVGICFHAGQGCAISSRLLIPESRRAEGIEIALEALRNVTYGDPTDPSNLMGPVISAKQQQRILALIDTARDEGANIVLGGGIPEHLPSGGFWVEPTVITDVARDSAVVRQEIFGPVLVVQTFADDDDAVAIANDSIYGLSGMITSGDLERAKAVTSRIRTGTMGINGGIWYGADVPFGGYKQSGIGRQCGVEGLEIYTETKSVAWPAATS
ncbi:MAG: aldehyde dehydrogenase family protein [Actinobacteria bacterium]|nr:aldehyde dehydrogenase family protein [Actinomycetota bacterium]